MVVVNFLAVFLPIDGRTTGEVARGYPSLFIPAGFTFIIWRFIYLLLAGFIYYQARGLTRGKPVHPGLVEKIGVFFILSSLANIGWIFTWHYNRTGLALGMIFILLVSLAFIYHRLGIGKTEVNRKEWLFTHLPFSVYPAWITISTVGNLSVYLVAIKWDGWGLSQTFWTVLAVFCLTALAGLFFRRYRDTAYVLTFVWAFLGVFYQRIFHGDPSYYAVGLSAVAAMVILLTLLFLAAKLPGKKYPA